MPGSNWDKWGACVVMGGLRSTPGSTCHIE